MVGAEKFLKFRVSILSETALSHIYIFLLCLVYSCRPDMTTSPQNTDKPSTYFKTINYV